MFSFLFSIAKAEDADSIMTCNGLDCDLCKLIKMIVDTVDTAVEISAAVAILFAVVGGFIYIGARGNDGWMAQAKRTVKLALLGFAFALTANLAVRVIFQVTGATNSGFLDKIDCNADGVATKENLDKISPSNAGQIAGSIKSGGKTGGKLQTEISSGEIDSLLAGISEKESIFFGSRINQSLKPFIGLAKKENDPEIIYLDNGLIQTLLKSKVSLDERKSIFGAPTVLAAGGMTDQGEKIMASVYQIVSQIQKKGNEVIVFVSKKSKENVSGTESKVSVGDFLKDFNDTATCLMSGGEWYKFSNPCALEKKKCDGISCSESSGSSTVFGCSCPSDKCLSGSTCVSKSEK